MISRFLRWWKLRGSEVEKAPPVDKEKVNDAWKKLVNAFSKTYPSVAFRIVIVLYFIAMAAYLVVAFAWIPSVLTELEVTSREDSVSYFTKINNPLLESEQMDLSINFIRNSTIESKRGIYTYISLYPDQEMRQNNGISNATLPESFVIAFDGTHCNRSDNNYGTDNMCMVTVTRDKGSIIYNGNDAIAYTTSGIYRIFLSPSRNDFTAYATVSPQAFINIPYHMETVEVAYSRFSYISATITGGFALLVGIVAILLSRNRNGRL